jgi:hypothetical protein
MAKLARTLGAIGAFALWELMFLVGRRSVREQFDSMP